MLEVDGVLYAACSHLTMQSTLKFLMYIWNLLKYLFGFSLCCYFSIKGAAL